MSATSKIVSILGLVCAFLLILATGRTNIRNFEKVQASIEGIYKDRLVVKGLIFEMNNIIHQKEVALLKNDTSFYKLNNETLNIKMDENLKDFKNTILTDNEAKTLNHFIKSFESVKILEAETGLETRIQAKDVQEILKQIQSLKEDLKTLSAIQLAEGKRKLTTSDHAIKSMNEFQTVENYMLGIFGVLIFLLIFVVPGPRRNNSLSL